MLSDGNRPGTCGTSNFRQATLKETDEINVMVYLTQYTPNAVISMCDGEPPAGSLWWTLPLSCLRAHPSSAQPRSPVLSSSLLRTSQAAGRGGRLCRPARSPGSGRAVHRAAAGYGALCEELTTTQERATDSSPHRRASGRWHHLYAASVSQEGGGRREQGTCYRSREGRQLWSRRCTPLPGRRPLAPDGTGTVRVLPAAWLKHHEHVVQVLTPPGLRAGEDGMVRSKEAQKRRTWGSEPRLPDLWLSCGPRSLSCTPGHEGPRP